MRNLGHFNVRNLGPNHNLTLTSSRFINAHVRSETIYTNCPNIYYIPTTGNMTKRPNAATNMSYAKRTKPASRRTNPRGVNTSRDYIAKIAQAVVNRNVEWKRHDVSAVTSIDSTGAATCLSLVPQGDTDITRDGDHLRATSLRVNTVVYANTTAPTVVRIIYLQWADDSTNSPPTVAAVLETTSPYSVLSGDYAARMKLLSDEMYVLDGVSNKSMCTRKKLVIPNQQIQFAGGTTQHTQGIWRIVLSDIASGASPPSFQCYTRLNYSDA